MVMIDRYYDPEGDILYLEFRTRSGPSKGIQLTDNIVIRVDSDTGAILKLVIHNYSRLVALSRDGHQTFAITELPASTSRLGRAILEALQSQPLNEFVELVPAAPTAPLHLSLTGKLLPRSHLTST
jgi:uncharacterized protein YuzE